MSTDANRKFELVKDETESLSLLREASKTLASTILWTKNQEKVINTSFHVFSEAEKAVYLAMPAGFDPKEFVNQIATSGTRECFFSVSLPRANVFFKTTFIGYDAGLKFKAPEQVFKVQRRSDLRFSVPNSYSIKVSFADPLFPEQTLTRKIIDISAGGMALLVSQEDEPLFTNGIVLETLTFVIKHRTIVCRAEVRHVSAYKPGTTRLGTKVGLIFKDIKTADSQHIAVYVFDENRKYFQSFVQE